MAAADRGSRRGHRRRAPAPVLLLSLLLAGCTSPPATHDPPVGTPPTCPTPHPATPFAHPAIQEASGIARSSVQGCVFWVHDDSGADPVLYAVDGAGGHLGEAWLGAPATDWEDIAGFTLDGAPFLLIADTGNNGASRSAVALLVLPEPRLAADAARVDVPAGDILSIALRYPGAPFDIEAVAVDVAADEILVVSKGETRLPADPSGPNQALYAATLSRALAEREAGLVFRTLIPGIRPGPGDPTTEFNYGIGSGRATAMDLRPDRGEVAILTYREILVWTRTPEQSWADALAGTPRAVAVPAPGNDQMEGLAYSHDGAFLLVTDEQGEVNSELTVVRAG